MNIKIEPDWFLATTPVIISVLLLLIFALFLIHWLNILFLLSSLSGRVLILSLFASYISYFIRVVSFFKGLGIIEHFLNIYFAEWILYNSKLQKQISKNCETENTVLSHDQRNPRLRVCASIKSLSVQNSIMVTTEHNYFILIHQSWF